MTLSRSAAPRPGPAALAALLAPLALIALFATPGQAHHLVEILSLPATPLAGMLSGLAHPLLGPDHLLFLAALSLVGLRQRLVWTLGLLAVGLGGSGLGLLLPGIPGAEALVALSLIAVALVLTGRWPRWLLLPAFACHGYVLSAAVLGWNAAPVGTYLVGLMISQGVLLACSLTLLRRCAARLTPAARRLVAAALVGGGAAWTWSALIG
jgi:urease accessory protein